jgi:hypothetical protein
MAKSKMFVLEGFEGVARGGAYFRSDIHKVLTNAEEKFGLNVVGIKMTPKLENGKPSYNVQFIYSDNKPPKTESGEA